MRAARLLSQLPTLRQAAIADYAGEFMQTWRRWPAAKDVAEKFGISGAEASADLGRLERLSYVRLNGCGEAELLPVIPLVGEVG